MITSALPTYDSLRFGSLNILNNHQDIDARLLTLEKEIQENDIQVLALQEVLLEYRPKIESLLYSLGYTSCAYANPVPLHTGYNSGNAIFSKLAPVSYENIDYNNEYFENKFIVPAILARLTYNGRNVYVFSAHLAWGGQFEQVRLRQATYLNQYARKIRTEDPDSIILLGGDLNAVEESSTIRYLKGYQENHEAESTYWVDAWTHRGTPDNWTTSNPKGYWGSWTARGNGILDPDSIPERRIDYILSYEWCYGKPGSPLSFGRFGDNHSNNEYELSDHYGIYSDILVPKKIKIQ